MVRSHEWLLTPERAAVHLPTATAVIADLHLGYAQARQQGGEAVPVRGLDEVLVPVRSLHSRHRLDRLVIAGDLFEKSRLESIAGEMVDWLRAIGIMHVGIVPGNHDRTLRDATKGLPIFCDGIEVGGWRVVHGDIALPDGKLVQGHIHPALHWGSLSAPCFLEARNHLVLPAFSHDAAGVNVLRDPRWRHYRCHVIAGDQLLDFGELAKLQKKRPKKERA